MVTIEVIVATINAAYILIIVNSKVVTIRSQYGDATLFLHYVRHSINNNYFKWNQYKRHKTWFISPNIIASSTQSFHPLDLVMKVKKVQQELIICVIESIPFFLKDGKEKEILKILIFHFTISKHKKILAKTHCSTLSY